MSRGLGTNVQVVLVSERPQCAVIVVNHEISESAPEIPKKSFALLSTPNNVAGKHGEPWINGIAPTLEKLLRQKRSPILVASFHTIAHDILERGARERACIFNHGAEAALGEMIEHCLPT